MKKVFSLMNRLCGEVRKNGIANTYYKVKEKQAKNLEFQNYDKERLELLPSKAELEAQRNHEFDKEITFSIVVPTYHTPELFLRQMIESVLGQTFCRVELCIADGSSQDCVENIVMEYAQNDCRIKYKRLTENKGISDNTNEGLAMATGDYIGLLDHDDLLELHALYEIRMALEKHPDAEVLYSDEDKVTFDLQHYFEPHYKPDFNPDLLRSNNYICHFLVMKRELLERIGGFRNEYDGAQDFDLVLRLTEKAQQVVHIPKVLYHWRSHEASTAANPMSKLYAYEAGKRAVESHLERCREAGVVSNTRFYGFYQTKYEMPEEMSVDLAFFSCNGENHKKILNNFSQDLHRQKVGNVIYYDNGFNKFVIFPMKAEMKSEILIFAEAGLSGVDEEALLQLAVNCSRSGIGMAGGRILSKKGILLYGRMEPDENGVLSHQEAGLPKGFTGYFHKAILQQNTEGVSPYLFAVRKELFDAWKPGVEGSAEEMMQQFCTFVKEKGYRISYVPIATAVRK